MYFGDPVSLLLALTLPRAAINAIEVDTTRLPMLRGHQTNPSSDRLDALRA
jgi:hypothetical protein